jgi:hypothetical protein
MRNFLGHDGFIWWVGIVEDVEDPLTLGRCKVRIFGYHPPKNTGNVPTEDLPWATSIHSPNTLNFYASLQKGDWVFGFFIDALSCQEPAILGYYPSVPATSDKQFSDVISAERNFKRVNTNGNSANTMCYQLGEHYLEYVKNSTTEANGHITLYHSTGSKINIDSNGAIQIYTANNITVTANNVTATVAETLTATAKNIALTASNTMILSANTLTISDTAHTWTPTTLYNQVENAKELPVPPEP